MRETRQILILPQTPLESRAPAAPTTTIAPVARDRLLLQACTELGLDPRRVLNVIQPISNNEALQCFDAKGKVLSFHRATHFNKFDHSFRQFFCRL